MQTRTAMALGYAAWIAGAWAGLFGGGTEAKLLLLAAAIGCAAPVWRRAWLVPYVWAVAMLVASLVYNQWANDANRSAIAAEEPATAGLEGVIASDVDVDGDRAVFILSAERWNGGPLGGERIRVTVRLQQQGEQDVARGWERGLRVRLEGELTRPLPATNFGGFDYREYLRQRRIHWLLEATGAEAVRADGRRAGLRHDVLRGVDRFRERLHEQVGKLYAPEQQAWMSGILFGYKDAMDPEQYKEFSEIGLAHILAISGMNVALIVSIVYWLLTRIGLTKEAARWCCIAFIPLFVAATGAEPPVVRAGIMAIIGLELMRRNRWKDSVAVLCAAGWMMLLWNPYYVADVSYQLSFAVTLGLIVGVPGVHRLLPALPTQLRGLVAVTIVAQAVSLPLTMLYFNHLSWASLPANLVLAPWIGTVLVPGGLLALALSYVWLPAAEAAARVTGWMNEWLFRAAEGLNVWDAYGWNVVSPPLWWLVMYVGALALILSAWTRARIDRGPPASPGNAVGRRRFRLAAAAGATIVVCLLLYIFQPYRFDPHGIVSVLDVGQGDAILVTTPEGRHILIDAGGTVKFQRPGAEWRDRRDPYEVGEDLIVPLLRQRGVQRLDAVILTHADTDHIGGAKAVVENIKVERVVINGLLRRQATALELYAAIVRRNIPIHAAAAGTEYRIGRHTTLTFYHPAPADSASRPAHSDEQNEASLVFVLQMYEHTFLFTGDIPAAAERAILESPDVPPVRDIDVLKVAHHGSRTSTVGEWLEAWKPEYAVISAGRNNRYGHPHPSVLMRLAERDIVIFQTARQGEIRFLAAPGRLDAAYALSGAARVGR